MPRHPHPAASVAGMSGSIFSALAHRVAASVGEVYPLHVGDTWMDPPPGCRMEDLRSADHPGMNRYTSPRGLPELLEAAAAEVTRRSRFATEPGEILVAAGATGALGAVIGATVDPGEEVLVLAPHWPLITGIVRSFHGVPRQVPFLGVADSAESAVEIVQEAASERTVALYLNTPNNPTSRLIPRSWLAALAEWARRRDLWLISDEVYEDYVFRGEHAYLRPFAPERTFSCYSFSKAYGMAGNRCGYVVGPAPLMGHLRKISTHTFYSTPTASQLAAVEALKSARPWVERAAEAYQLAGDEAARRLGVEAPEGSTFLFLDVGDALDETGLLGFLERAAERGLFLAPGPSFGPYPRHVRLCFTSAPPAVVARGVGVLAELLGL